MPSRTARKSVLRRNRVKRRRKERRKRERERRRWRKRRRLRKGRRLRKRRRIRPHRRVPPLRSRQKELRRRFGNGASGKKGRRRSDGDFGKAAKSAIRLSICGEFEAKGAVRWCLEGNRLRALSKEI